MQLNFVSTKTIRSKDAQYNLLIGERSNGKTTAVAMDIVERYFKTGEQGAVLRRWDTDFSGANSARTIFDSVCSDAFGVNHVEKWSGGRYSGVEYYAGKYFFTIFDEEKQKIIRDRDAVFAYGFALNKQEHYKSGGGGYPNVTTILFDEFISRGAYLTDEFIVFQNMLSTIIRHRDNVKIFMCGNTVNRYCPYYAEMGLSRMKDMRVGDIDVYTYGKSGLRVAVQFTDSLTKTGKKSDVYFAFDNPRLKMITEGAWEIDLYPHCPERYAPNQVVFEYFIEFDGERLHAEVVSGSTGTFTYIHRKTTPIKEDTDLLFSTADSISPYRRKNILNAYDRLGKRIVDQFRQSRVFYQDNEVGECVNNYLLKCRKDGMR